MSDVADGLRRPVRASDLDAIATMQEISIMALGAPVYGEDKAKAWARLGYQFRYDLIGEGAFWVAEQEERIWRRRLVAGQPGGGPCLATLSVRPPGGDRRGIGRRLVERTERSACAAGRPRVRVWSSLNAIGFYRAVGFVPERRARWPVRTGIELDYVLMGKRAAAAASVPIERRTGSGGHAGGHVDRGCPYLGQRALAVAGPGAAARRRRAPEPRASPVRRMPADPVAGRERLDVLVPLVDRGPPALDQLEEGAGRLGRSIWIDPVRHQQGHRGAAPSAAPGNVDHAQRLPGRRQAQRRGRDRHQDRIGDHQRCGERGHVEWRQVQDHEAIAPASSPARAGQRPEP